MHKEKFPETKGAQGLAVLSYIMFRKPEMQADQYQANELSDIIFDSLQFALRRFAFSYIAGVVLAVRRLDGSSGGGLGQLEEGEVLNQFIFEVLENLLTQVMACARQCEYSAIMMHTRRPWPR